MSKTSMRVPLIDLSAQHKHLRRELSAAVVKVLDSQQFVLKDSVAELEKRIAGLCGATEGIGLASGSDALYLALMSLGVGPQDEVITTPFTFFATAGSISRCGAKPVFADIDERTFNLDPASVASKITPKTKAVIAVHLFGLMSDMKPLLEVTRKRKLPLIEDAAQAIGASADGAPAGSLGEIGCLSFYPTKNLGGAGDGGMAVTRSTELAAKMRLLRDHGSKRKYHHDEVGINSRLDEIQAAVLLVKLKQLAKWNRQRADIAAEYDKGLRGLPVRTPYVPKGSRHVYHLYSILAERRDELAAFLSAEGIGCGVYYPLPLHLQACYKGLGYRRGDLPRSERAAELVLSLPMYPELPVAARKKVIEAIRRFYGTGAGR